MPARLLQKPFQGTSSAPSFLPGPGPRPALHDLLQPREPRRWTAAWAQAGAHTRGTGGPWPTGRHHHLPPTHTQSHRPCAEGSPDSRAGSGVRSPPERPQAQSPGAAPCPLPFSAGNNRCPCFRPPRPLQLPGSCSEGPAPTGHGLAEGVLGRRRARESDALEMAAWRSSYFCPDPLSTLVTASQTTRQA